MMRLLIGFSRTVVDKSYNSSSYPVKLSPTCILDSIHRLTNSSACFKSCCINYSNLSSLFLNRSIFLSFGSLWPALPCEPFWSFPLIAASLKSFWCSSSCLYICWIVFYWTVFPLNTSFKGLIHPFPTTASILLGCPAKEELSWRSSHPKVSFIL